MVRPTDGARMTQPSIHALIVNGHSATRDNFGHQLDDFEGSLVKGR